MRMSKINIDPQHHEYTMQEPTTSGYPIISIRHPDINLKNNKSVKIENI